MIVDRLLSLLVPRRRSAPQVADGESRMWVDDAGEAVRVTHHRRGTVTLASLGGAQGAARHRGTALAWVARDAAGDVSDQVVADASLRYRTHPTVLSYDDGGVPVVLDSWNEDRFFGGSVPLPPHGTTVGYSGCWVGAVPAGSVSNVTATYSDGHAWMRYTSATGTTATCGIATGGFYATRMALAWKCRFTFRVSAISAGYTLWMGAFSAAPTSASSGSAHHVALRWVQGTDTHIQLSSKDGTTQSTTSTGVAMAAATTYEVVMAWDGATFLVSINGTTVTKTANMPASSTPLGLYLMLYKSSGATAYQLDIRDGHQLVPLQEAA